MHGLLVHHTPTIDSTISFLASLHRIVAEEVRSGGVPIVLPQEVSPHSLPSDPVLPNLAEVTRATGAQLGSTTRFSGLSVNI